MTELMGHHSQRAVFTVTAFAGNKRVTFPGWSNKFGKNTAGMAGRLSSHTGTLENSRPVREPIRL